MTDPRMTPTNDAPATVEQCDRQLFIYLLGFDAVGDEKSFDRIRAGQFDHWDKMQRIARHRLAALASAPAEEAFTGVEAWDELVNGDDRTSPEEYPDMCLITRDELIDFMQRASAPPGDGAVEQIADIIADHVSGPDIAKGHADAASHRSDQLSAAKAILAALDRPRAAVGEPVAWMYEKKSSVSDLVRRIVNADRDKYAVGKGWTETPLYPPPAKVEG